MTLDKNSFRGAAVILGVFLFGSLFGGAIQAGYPCPDTTGQTEALELGWTQQVAQLRGRAFRAEQETADAMMEAARLRDMLAWDAAYYWRIEVGSPEWAAARRAAGLVDNGVLAVEQGAVR